MPLTFVSFRKVLKVSLLGLDISTVFIVTVHGFKEVQGFILVPRLHLGCAFTRKASASSGLIQDSEPNWQLLGEMGIFNKDFGV